MRVLLTLLVLPACLALPWVSLAQDVEPRRWTHLPVGLNVVGAGYVYTAADIFFDPVLMVEDAELDAHTALASYSRFFGLSGKTARLDLLVPVTKARWQGLLDGVFTTVRRDGFADPIIRLSVNLVGAPALKGKDFGEFRTGRPINTVVGTALGVLVPLGENMKNKLLNLGGNRFIFRPQFGVLHTRGRWAYELTGSVFLFTENDEFWNGNKLEQDPIYTLQTHLIHTFRPGLWISLSGAYGWDGESEVNDVPKNDPRDAFLSALSLGFPIVRNHGLKVVYIRTRAQHDIGADTDSVVLGWMTSF
jgi:hypothetical protein